MRKWIVLLLSLIVPLSVLAQEGFQFENKVDKVSIPFKFINNLVFIPIKVNGIELNFLLDTGVEETILFSLEDKKEISFSNIEKITLRGLGSDEAIEGLKSTGNTLELNDMKSWNHPLYIILDQDFNLSSHIGIPVNGIIGYQFFKNQLVEINYEKKRVILYKENLINKKKIERKYNSLAITIEKSKPYLKSSIVIDSVEIPAKLLIDVGNSDAIWLFQNKSKSIKIPVSNFEDYLGKGFSGDVEGKRARIPKFRISDFEFLNPIVAFPDSTSLKNVKMVDDRVGSVGGEILRRFSIVFDYSNEKLFLKKNREFSSPFHYNKSGLEIQHHGLQWVQETVRLQTVPIYRDTYDSKSDKTLTEFKYKFQLKPIFEIANVRKNSPAAKSGIQKGDIITKINNNPGYKYSLEEINSLLKSEEEKWISIEIERDSQVLKFRFQLLNVL